MNIKNILLVYYHVTNITATYLDSFIFHVHIIKYGKYIKSNSFLLLFLYISVKHVFCTEYIFILFFRT